VDTDNVSAPSLVLDAADRPHISYCRGEHCGEGYAWGGSLRYAHWTGDTWDVQTVDSDGYSGEYTSIALDSGGRPHISYYAGYPNVDLKYAWYDGADWRITTVDSEGFVGQYTSLALDAADQPHISYRGAGLKYAWHDGADWRIETVDDSDRHTSLALDALSRPHISYYDGGRLKYAIGGQPLSLRKSAAPSGDLSNNTLAYTLTLCTRQHRRHRHTTGGLQPHHQGGRLARDAAHRHRRDDPLPGHARDHSCEIARCATSGDQHRLVDRHRKWTSDHGYGEHNPDADSPLARYRSGTP
jgi:hypothetical protein